MGKKKKAVRKKSKGVKKPKVQARDTKKVKMKPEGRKHGDRIPIPPSSKSPKHSGFGGGTSGLIDEMVEDMNPKIKRALKNYDSPVRTASDVSLEALTDAMNAIVVLGRMKDNVSLKLVGHVLVETIISTMDSNMDESDKLKGVFE